MIVGAGETGGGGPEGDRIRGTRSKNAACLPPQLILMDAGYAGAGQASGRALTCAGGDGAEPDGQGDEDGDGFLM
ncbi:MAG: hypothetical protein PHY05_03820 [Methanothrix sp.]|nr:hypothetical protein [Methanothrix sp.]